MKKLILIILLLLTSSTTFAQTRQEALARYCINEVSFSPNIINDCTAIATVLRNRSSTGHITLGIIRAYSRGEIFNHHRSDPMRWVPFLNRFGRRPRYWNESTTIPWSRRRSIWMRVYHLSGRILHHEIHDKCRYPAHHWGNSTLDRRSRRRGWIRSQCHSINHFWTVPELLPYEERVCR